MNEEEKFDFCISKDTLEHIPKWQIKKIFYKISKLLVNDGVFISCIDYSDHFSHTSKNLNKLNFLKYSLAQWKIYNPPNHYQNRLRHSDYIELLEKNNFKVVFSERIGNENINFKTDNAFNKYSNEDLLALGGKFIAKLNITS